MKTTYAVLKNRVKLMRKTSFFAVPPYKEKALQYEIISRFNSLRDAYEYAEKAAERDITQKRYYINDKDSSDYAWFNRYSVCTVADGAPRIIGTPSILKKYDGIPEAHKNRLMNIPQPKPEITKTVYRVYVQWVKAKSIRGNYTEKEGEFEFFQGDYETEEEATQAAQHFAKDAALGKPVEEMGWLVFTRYISARDFLDEDGDVIDSEFLDDFDGVPEHLIQSLKA